MKYLHTFNESVKDFLTYSEILDEIKSILLPISDLGYEIEAELVKDYIYHMFVRIVDYSKEPLEFNSDILDEIERLYDFTKDNGFIIDRVWYKEVRDDGRIFNKGNRESCGYESFIEMLYYKKLAYLSLELRQIER
jgi:hypothetical protein